MRTLEEEAEDNRWTMQKQERELQKKVDLLRSNHSKIESEMILKDKEVTTMRDEINIIRNQITEVITFSYFYINNQFFKDKIVLMIFFLCTYRLV